MNKSPRDHKQRPQNLLETLKFVKKQGLTYTASKYIHSKFLYSYDLRGRGPENARHWSDDHVLGTSRAKFFMAKTNIKKTKEPLLSVLKIRGIRDRDRGLYRCRVDFKAAPTRNTRANLTVIGKYYLLTTRVKNIVRVGK